MTVTLVLISATVILCALYLMIIATLTYWRFHGPIGVTCPETQQPASVEVDALHAAITATIDATELQLTRCSRWPQHQGCGQGCLRHLALASEDYLVRTDEKPTFQMHAGHDGKVA